MRKTMNIWALLGVLACIMLLFFLYSGSQGQTIAELNDLYDQSRIRLDNLKAENASLKIKRQTVGSDTFVENQARTQYGYMMPDEIRLVITNPEALYGAQGIPSR